MSKQQPIDPAQIPVMPSWAAKGLEVILDRWGKAGGHRRVEGKKDWEVVAALWKLWKMSYPEEFIDYTHKMQIMRSGAFNKHASSENSADEGQIRHIAEFPGRFDRMLIIFYPDQTYGKKFLRDFVKYIPETRVPDKI